MTVAKIAGKRVLRTVATKGMKAGKTLIKEGIHEAVNLGKDLATQGLNILAETAIDKGAPADVIHNIQDVVRGGAHTAVDGVGSLANKGVDKLASQLDTRLQSEDSPSQVVTALLALSPSKVALPALASTPRKVSGSIVQNNRRRQRAKRKQLSNSYPLKAKVARLLNDIEEL